MVAEQVVEYEIDGKKVQYTIKRITYGAWQKVMGTIGGVEYIGGVTKSKIDVIKLTDELMKVAVTGTPDYHELSMADGQDLQAKVLSFNGMGEQGTFRA